jgi:PIN domain nuclease of toxin-antitoxin system
MTGFLVDTCALIWLVNSDDKANFGAVESTLNMAYNSGTPVYMSPISAWEIAMLAAKGRLPIAMSPRAWIDQLITRSGLLWVQMPVEVLLASNALPADPHGDPADRIIIATAREYGMRIVTRDQKILDYAEKGHVMALAC